MPDRPPVDMRFQPFSSLVLPSPCCDKNDGLTFSQKAPGAIDMNSSVKIKLKLLNIFSSDVQVVGAYLRTLINCFRWQIYTKFTGSFLLGRKWAKTYCKDVVVSLAFLVIIHDKLSSGLNLMKYLLVLRDRYLPEMKRRERCRLARPD